MCFLKTGTMSTIVLSWSTWRLMGWVFSYVPQFETSWKSKVQPQACHIRGGVCSQADRRKKNNLSPLVFCEKEVQIRKMVLSRREAEGLEFLILALCQCRGPGKRQRLRHFLPFDSSLQWPPDRNHSSPGVCKQNCNTEHPSVVPKYLYKSSSKHTSLLFQVRWEK